MNQFLQNPPLTTVGKAADSDRIAVGIGDGVVCAAVQTDENVDTQLLKYFSRFIFCALNGRKSLPQTILLVMTRNEDIKRINLSELLLIFFFVAKKIEGKKRKKRTGEDT
jgi:hypothetical protein